MYAANRIKPFVISTPINENEAEPRPKAAVMEEKLKMVPSSDELSLKLLEPVVNTKPSKLPKPSGNSKVKDAKKTAAASSSPAQKNRLKVFQAFADKICDSQSDYMRRCLTLKGINEPNIPKFMQFVAIIQNDNCSLLVTLEDSLHMPRNIPTESLQDFKHDFISHIDSNKKWLTSQLSLVTRTDDPIQCRHEIECLRESLIHQLNKRVDPMMKLISKLCQISTVTATDDKWNTILRDLHEVRLSHSKAEKKLQELNRRNAEDQYLLACNYRTMIEMERKQSEDKRMQLEEQIESYELNFSQLLDGLSEADEIIEQKHSEILSMKQKIIVLRHSYDEHMSCMEIYDDELSACRRLDCMRTDVAVNLKDRLLEVRAHLQKVRESPDMQNLEYNNKDSVVLELQMELLGLKTRSDFLERELSRCKAAEEKVKDMKKMNLETKGEVQMLKNKLINRPAEPSELDIEDLKQQLLQYQQEIANNKLL